MNNKPQEIFLIPDRQCGKCTACCHSLLIDTTELVKLPNVTCGNLQVNGNCSIYKNRPSLCEKYYCAWRNMPELDKNWRPDKMGVIIEFCRENFPGHFAGKTGFRFNILDKEKLFLNLKFVRFVERQILNQVPCILSYSSLAGEIAPAAFLNMALHNAVMNRDPLIIKKEILKAIAACEKMPKEKLQIKSGQLITVV